MSAQNTLGLCRFPPQPGAATGGGNPRLEECFTKKYQRRIAGMASNAEEISPIGFDLKAVDR
jgi:hypothetical protein